MAVYRDWLESAFPVRVLRELGMLAVKPHPAVESSCPEPACHRIFFLQPKLNRKLKHLK
ncbi:hypothetical protein M3650_21870 [Paenibacillus sp. MER TA 81-3]|uniref:hypothetical protein n=1 Tax=Paenibacillus sp. MER TA 81-3 TaxID=2939573 RepID=UPI002040A8D3|nr:hypothetical protein [Paenibacillus sp. MER TA 81-3]MCM3341205.1 hypothetical protein [Paenibacillus sp. MER TA 81-3]